MEDKKQEKVFIYMQENLIQSIIGDVITFGTMIGGLFLNHYFLDKRWYIDIFFIIFSLLMAVAKTKSKRFTNKADLEKYLKELV